MFLADGVTSAINELIFRAIFYLIFFVSFRFVVIHISNNAIQKKAENSNQKEISLSKTFFYSLPITVLVYIVFYTIVFSILETIGHYYNFSAQGNGLEIVLFITSDFLSVFLVLKKLKRE